MFLYIPALLQTILFAVVLKAVSLFDNFFWFLLFFLLFISLIGARIVIRNWLLWYSIGLFSVSSWVMLHLIDYSPERNIFIFLSSLVYYFFLFGGYRINKNKEDEVSRGIIAMVLMATVFLFLSATHGIYLNFELSSWWLMLFYFANIFIISYRYFAFIETKKKNLVMVYSLVMGFAMLEMGWVVNFWPFGYLTSGFVMLMFYYILWDLSRDYFSGSLSKKTVLINLILFMIISGMVLFSSKWLLQF